MRTITAAAAALTVALTATACTTTEVADTAASPTAGANRPAETAPESSPTASEPPEEPSPADDPLAGVFGEPVAYDDGVQMTVGPPQPYEPTDTAFITTEGGTPLQFQVTVVNGGTERLDPFGITLSVQSTNVEAEEIFDTEGGLNGPPTTAILPGREATFAVGFVVADPADIVMQGSPGFLYDPAFWTTQ